MRTGHGLTYALLASASYGLMSYVVHWNPHQFPVEQMTFLRSVFIVLCLLPFCWRDLPVYARTGAGMLWLRALAGSMGLFLYYYTLQGTVSANANFLFSSSPLFVSVFGWLLLRERLGQWEVLGVALILVSNVLLYLPNQGAMPLWVWQTGIAGALVSSLAYLALGPVARRYSSALIVLGVSAMSAVCSLLVPGRPWQEMSLPGWGYLLALSVLSLSSQLFTTLSFAHLKSATATSIGRSSVLFSGVLDIALAGYRPHPLEWLSYLLIVAGVAFTQHRGKRKA